MNKVMLLGNLARDIELRYTQGGTKRSKHTVQVDNILMLDAKESNNAQTNQPSIPDIDIDDNDMPF